MKKPSRFAGCMLSLMLALLLLVTTSGCGTTLSLKAEWDGAHTPNIVFSGVRKDIEYFKTYWFQNFTSSLITIGLFIDVPISLLADIVCLPVTAGVTVSRSIKANSAAARR
ncbi:MAG: hypothetical protein NUW37_03260 [Planctomycetes bacterium]|nr:hypothetical protein [Planctomycetota bacterium]